MILIGSFVEHTSLISMTFLFNPNIFVSMCTQPCSVLLILIDMVLAQVHVLSSHAEHTH